MVYGVAVKHPVDWKVSSNSKFKVSKGMQIIKLN